MTENELYHYGVKGMKWGVRKEYEPHPRKRKPGTLNISSRRSTNKTNVGYRSSSSQSSQNNHERLKKVAKIGALVAGSALATYGAYRLVKSGKAGKLIKAGQKVIAKKGVKVSAKNTAKTTSKTFTPEIFTPKTVTPKTIDPKTVTPKTIDPKTVTPKTFDNVSAKDFVKNSLSKSNNIDPKTGFKRYTKKMSAVENAKKVNPNYSVFDQKSFMNCGNCTIAMELRMRGLDVKALGNEQGLKFNQLLEAFEGVNSKSFYKFDYDLYDLNLPDIMTRARNPKTFLESGKKVEDVLKKNIANNFPDDNARGAMIFPHANGSHWINWVKEGGDVKFYDAQNPNVNLQTDLFGQYTHYPNMDVGTVIRLDDLNIRNSEIRRFVTDANGKFELGDTKAYIDKGENFVKVNPDIKQLLEP